MEKRDKTICHDGTVTHIDHQNIKVTISSTSACSGCHSKSACPISSEVSTKIIEIENCSIPLRIGEKVIVKAKETDAFISIFFAYILPTILILICLIIGHILGVSEIIGALSSLLITAIYFTVLFLLRNKFKKRIKFEIEKQ